jgi:hypothetical protein
MGSAAGVGNDGGGDGEEEQPKGCVGVEEQAEH